MECRGAWRGSQRRRSEQVRAPRELRLSYRPERQLEARLRSCSLGHDANFGFSAPAGTDIRRVVLWRYGTGTVSVDDPNTPEKEVGRWEINAQFDGNSLFADTCRPGCIACSTADGSNTPLGHLNLQGATVTLEDTSAPTVKLGGSLFAPYRG
jgi:hypothetical protein